MRYEITIRQLDEYSPEEEVAELKSGRRIETYSPNRYSDTPHHEIRILQAEISKEEFEAVKKAIINVM